MVKKNILISGSANGLGLEISKFLSENNNQNVNLYLIDKDKKIKKISQKLNAKYLIKDLRDLKNLKGFPKKIDFFFNNAAITEKKNFIKKDLNRLTSEINVNLISPILILKNISNKNKKIKVINILSTTIFFPTPSYSIYSSSKLFLYKFFENLRGENDNKIIYQNIIIGSLNTNFSKKAKMHVPKYLVSDKKYAAKKICEISLNFKNTGDNYIGINAKIIGLIKFILPNYIFQKLFEVLFKVMR